jgi:hypothetical protein
MVRAIEVQLVAIDVIKVITIRVVRAKDVREPESLIDVAQKTSQDLAISRATICPKRARLNLRPIA